ncbi:MAG: hypothetical protein M3010_09230 [Candidatus Dormibacteraeota bacterium]|nr:hypothetical protein [Candidatus Dormibacteraeota bacterium]
MRAHPPDERTVTRHLELARRRLSPARFERASRDGELLPLDAAVALARQGTTPR